MINIQHIDRNQFLKSIKAPLQLKPGQILQGKIMKIFPNNKAEIQLGNQTMIAQLEAPLQTGKAYHFQVQGKEDIIHLKVLSEMKQGKDIGQQAEHLLKQLGMKGNKLQSEFVQFLLNEKIPFQRSQLQQSFQLLTGTADKSTTFSLLKTMISKQIPISEEFFQALYTRGNHNLSELINELKSYLEQQNLPVTIQKNALAQLTQFLSQPNTPNPLLALFMQGSEEEQLKLFQMLKSLGIIGQKLDFSAWKSQMQISQMGEISNDMASTVRSLHEGIIKQELLANEEQIRNPSQLILQKWHHIIQTNRPMEALNFQLLSHDIANRIIAQASSGLGQALQTLLQNTPASLQELMQALQVLQAPTSIDTKVTELPDAIRNFIIQQDAQILSGNGRQISSNIQSFLNQWLHLMKNTIELQQPMENRVFQAFQRDLAENIIPSIPRNTAQWILSTLQNSPTSIQQIAQYLQALQLPNAIEASTPLWSTASQTLMEKELQSLLRNETALRNSIQTVMQQWPVSPDSSSFSLFARDVMEHVLPNVSRNFAQGLDSMLQNNPKSIQQLMQTMQLFTGEDVYQQANHLLTMREPMQFHFTKEQFMTQLKQYLQLMGFSEGNAQTEVQESSIKHMLTQLLQQGEQGVNQRATQLMHMVNGLQLTALNESNNLIHASLQLPGKMFGLPEDFQLEFEGQKTVDGKLNSDYCRIVFFLHLGNLQDTTIDMHVQKRVVSITIFNDNTELQKLGSRFQKLLEEGLEEIGYVLSNVTYKPYSQQNTVKHVTTYQNQSVTAEGVDFRI